MGTELIKIGTKVILRRIKKFGCIIDSRVAFISTINDDGTYSIELDSIGSKKNITIFLRNIAQAFDENNILIYEYDIRNGD